MRTLPGHRSLLPTALLSLFALVFAASLSPACSEQKLEQVGEFDAGQDAGPDAGDDGGSDAGDAGPDAGTDAGAPLLTARLIAHLHSPLSHDACDGHSDHTGGLAGRDQDCLQQLEDGLCASRIDVAFLTDHPSYVSEQTRDDALLKRAGRGEVDELTDGGLAVGNRILCPGGRSVFVATGVEGTHTMPIGLEQKLPRYGVATDVGASLADLSQLRDEIHAAGGLYFIAHSEEKDLPTAVMQQTLTDGMEWYNPHGNFKQLYGGDTIGAGVDLAHLGDFLNTLKGLEPFLFGSSAQADLLYLVLLSGGFPEAGITKVHDVLGVRRVTAVLGSDVHQNVSIQPVCKGVAAQLVCNALAAAYPSLLTALIAGGQVKLSDGERLDSYPRILRWLNNRALVTEISVQGAKEALRLGRIWSVFAVFGEPGPFAFWADGADGRHELGSEVALAGTTLHVRMPDIPKPELGAQWTETQARTAWVRTVLWRTTAAGKVKAAEWPGVTLPVDYVPTEPGAYTVEVWITPHHLEAALGPKAAAFASKEYRWVLSNPIYVR